MRWIQQRYEYCDSNPCGFRLSGLNMDGMDIYSVAGPCKANLGLKTVAARMPAQLGPLRLMSIMSSCLFRKFRSVRPWEGCPSDGCLAS